VVESKQPGDQEMITVIADFLEQGLADNIVSMFRSDPQYYQLVGEILQDERFAVRMGMVLVFDELAAAGVTDTARAVPVLKPLLAPETPAYIRGEAVTLLGIIGTEESLELLAPLVRDDDPQIVEIARDYIDS
jgi:HEAT repeat protein